MSPAESDALFPGLAKLRQAADRVSAPNRTPEDYVMADLQQLIDLYPIEWCYLGIECGLRDGPASWRPRLERARDILLAGGTLRQAREHVDAELPWQIVFNRRDPKIHLVIDDGTGAVKPGNVWSESETGITLAEAECNRHRRQDVDAYLVDDQGRRVSSQDYVESAWVRQDYRDHGPYKHIWEAQRDNGNAAVTTIECLVERIASQLAAVGRVLAAISGRVFQVSPSTVDLIVEDPSQWENHLFVAGWLGSRDPECSRVMAGARGMGEILKPSGEHARTAYRRILTGQGWTPDLKPPARPVKRNIFRVAGHLPPEVIAEIQRATGAEIRHGTPIDGGAK